MTIPMLIRSSDFVSILLGSAGESKCSICVELKGWWHKRPLGGKYL